MNYKTKAIEWDDLSIPMFKRKGGEMSTNIISEDPGDKDLPPFMQKATQRMTKGMKANAYDKHTFKDMIDRCGHLNVQKKNTLKNLFSQFKELFSGTLGKVPGEKIK